MTTWPYPGDSPLVRARRVALAYRQQLQQHQPDACATLDQHMRALGQHWAIPRPVTADPDAWIPAADAAELAAVSVAQIAGLRRSGRLHGRRDTAGKWHYRVADIQGLALQPRTRKHRAQTGES